MAWKTLMVHLKLAHANDDLLRVTADLAKRFDARVIGISGCQPSPGIYTDGYLPGTFVEEDRKEINLELAEAKAEFKGAFPDAATAEWRSATLYETVADYVARECRSADLIVTSGLSFNPHDTARPEAPGDIVMQAGRPVLVVPRTANTLKLNHLVIAWKDTREARRAAADALPLLALATKVTVLEIAHEDERTRVTEQLGEIVGWLKIHAIDAAAAFVPSTKGDDAYQLNTEALRLGTDVVVAGAYGHSRIREWAFGGVTRDLTLQATYCSLMSH